MKLEDILFRHSELEKCANKACIAGRSGKRSRVYERVRACVRAHMYVDVCDRNAGVSVQVREGV